MIEDIVQNQVLGKFAYQTYGPFNLSSSDDLSSGLIADDYWDDLDEKCPGLRSAIGIYIFVVRPTKKSALKPWYVGKTDIGFEKRFHSHKNLFAKLLQKKGKVAVFLLARLGHDRTAFMGAKKRLASNEVLETMLIERCLEVNKKLFNAKKINYVRGLIVPGFKGKTVGKPKRSASQLKHMLKRSVLKES